MGLFGPTYAAYDTIEAAKSIQERAVNDHSYDVPAKEAKLLKKLASESDNRKLFYFALVSRPPIRTTAISRITDPRAVSSSEELIVRCLKEYPLESMAVLKKLSPEGRKSVALHAKSEDMRSLAARTLLDTGHVRVLRNRCRYCGGEVEITRAQAGTIEAHNFYRCKQCGRTEHETVLDSVPMAVEKYIYEE